ncbi:hypothetical protein [Kitasatospora viridis]|uniref:PH (Pleckstrin Homology) domain-containing protein n=1 Tax=Kitasatospora viridis TaxID=281105 RepID=A0A561T6Z6_9ACTN|nr:hypothetical protein [Kitasatospora viridis]TWF82896.1 hypothetical protein FHX73_14378 [Kitasatospora viridis]
MNVSVIQSGGRRGRPKPVPARPTPARPVLTRPALAEPVLTKPVLTKPVPARPVKAYPKYQRLLSVVGGLASLGTSAAGVAVAPVEAKALCAVVVAGSVAVCRRGSRLGVVADRDGLVDRSMGGVRRISWREVRQITVGSGTETDVPDAAGVSVVVLRLHDGQVLRLWGTARHSRASVVEIRQRLVAIQATDVAERW